MDAKTLGRFMNKVEVLESGCWLWLGARSRGKGNKKWYGSFRIGKKTVRAHVFASDYIAGYSCPSGYHRDHKCSLSLCVNPAHLEVVPKEVNQERKISRRSKTKHEPFYQPGLMAFS